MRWSPRRPGEPEPVSKAETPTLVSPQPQWFPTATSLPPQLRVPLGWHSVVGPDRVDTPTAPIPLGPRTVHPPTEGEAAFPAATLGPRIRLPEGPRVEPWERTRPNASTRPEHAQRRGGAWAWIQCQRHPGRLKIQRSRRDKGYRCRGEGQGQRPVVRLLRKIEGR